ncbi:MAG: ribosome maturation factor RimP [Clostridia bacterium]|nr:ribosome maturation factor RimP [Clostridia bacterium]
MACHSFFVVMAGNKNIAETVFDFLLPVVNGLGFYLWDVEYVKEGSEWYLRVTIDSEDGITIDDCEVVHRAIDPIIDEHDPIENSYRLEVSSPGIERVLRTREHIEAFAGEEVEAKLFAAIDGKKSLRGILGGIKDGVVTITVGENTYEIEHKKISRMTTVFDF